MEMLKTSFGKDQIESRALVDDDRNRRQSCGGDGRGRIVTGSFGRSSTSIHGRCCPAWTLLCICLLLSGIIVLLLCMDIRMSVKQQASQLQELEDLVQDMNDRNRMLTDDAQLAHHEQDDLEGNYYDDFQQFGLEPVVPVGDSEISNEEHVDNANYLDIEVSMNAYDDQDIAADEPVKGIDGNIPIANTQNSKVDVDNGKVSQTTTTNVRQCDLIPDSWKFDCYPEPDVSESGCEQRGCCWQLSNWTGKRDIGVPSCFYPKDYKFYKTVGVKKTSYGFQYLLNLTRNSYYPEDVAVLRIDVFYETEYRLHVKITDALNKRYEVPVPILPVVKEAVDDAEYEFNLESDVGFKVVRKSTGKIIFDASVGAFIFANQFLQLSAVLPSTYLYGLGEQRDSFVRSFDWNRVTLMNSDHVPQENTNLYGSHPFYLLVEERNQSHGVLLFNSNPMDIILQPAPAITYRTIGGVLDFYFFLGPTPAQVISQYTELIGRPFMPPYWSLGFHLCRYGYPSTDRMKSVWQRTRDAGIPFDVQWTDIDYMDKRRDFTLDKVNFGNLSVFVQELHSVGMHYVPIIDCAIGVSSKPGEYPAYDDGVEMDIFVKNDSGQDFQGKVWPGISVWPDFTNENATFYWAKQFEKFHMTVPFDGAWIDMNEPSNFFTGTVDGCPNSKWDNPPYVPAVTGGKLAYLTVCMSALQNASRHYDVHNIYGFTEAIATNVALTSVRQKRPFIISRSSFPGHGHFAGVWTGDVASEWHDMGRSVADILNFNLFGIPMVGADICGFNGNTTVKLCQRWMELGAFYPFARNHNARKTIEQDPVALGVDVTIASLKAFTLRYKLLPYLYTLFIHAHMKGETVARPLFFEFPEDEETYIIDTQFLWGSGLMILPVLEEDVTILNPYFPAGVWYLLPSNKTINSSGSSFVVDAPLDTIVVALRGGTIFPVQGVNRTTTASRYQEFGLWVALCEMGRAKGEIYWDDGDSLDTEHSGIYNLVSFNANESVISSSVKHYAYYGENSMTLGNVLVYGVYSPPVSVFVNGTSHPFHYEQNTQILQVDFLQIRLEYPFTISWK